MRKHITILMGGWSAEREVSLASGAAVSKALSRSDAKVTLIDVQKDAHTLLAQLNPKPDVVFNALHGRYGEDGCIQGLLNILDIPYTHSGVLASAIAMNKPMTKNILKQVGIKVAAHKIIKTNELSNAVEWDPPYVIKPINEGSSVGVSIVEKKALHESEDFGPSLGSDIMLEQYIPGTELTVAVMGDNPLAVTEIGTERKFYDYDAKYLEGGSIHQIPAEIPSEIYEEALRISVLAHKTLGCRGVSRSDIRFDGDQLYLLEVNTQPGMTPTSLVPEQARYSNISFEELVNWLVEQAVCDS